MKRSQIMILSYLTAWFILTGCGERNRAPVQNNQERLGAADSIVREDRGRNATDTSERELRLRNAEKLDELPQRVADQIGKDKDLNRLRLVNTRKYEESGETFYAITFDREGDSVLVVMDENGQRIERAPGRLPGNREIEN